MKTIGHQGWSAPTKGQDTWFITIDITIDIVQKKSLYIQRKTITIIDVYYYKSVLISPSLIPRGQLKLNIIGKKSTSRQRSGNGAIRKRPPPQKPRREKTKPTTRHPHHGNIS